MKFNLFIFVLLTGITSFSGFSQNQTKTGIKVGDTLPPVMLKNLLQPTVGKTDISNLYRKGGLIINFWATWCVPCTREIKLLDSLASENPDQLSVLSVTYEPDDVATSFLKRLGAPKSTNLIVSTGDTTLHRYFPHRSIPHNIWIDHTGVVRSITSGEEINRKNINSFLNNRTEHLYQKDDDLSFDFSKPYHIPDTAIGYRSQISRFNERITSGVTYNNKIGGSTQRYFSWNTRVAELFWMAYCKQLTPRINWNLVELHTRDSVRFFHPKTNLNQFERSRYHTGNFTEDERRWNKENLFCYDLILPREVNNEQVSAYMFNDLQRYFNMKANIITRKKQCRLISFSPSLPIKADNTATASIELKDGAFIVNNQTIDELMLYLYDWLGNEQPYINDSGISYPISFTLYLPPLNGRETYSEKEIWEAMKKQGLNYRTKTRPYPVLVLTDLN
jgi:thiol-disulfide isomerase/thioredoxin